MLQLLQLCDSALPVGSSAHSFGLETLVAEELLTVDSLEGFLQAYLEETGLLEGSFFVRGRRLAAVPGLEEFLPAWRTLNVELSALKPARESRQASVMLGRRLLHLVQDWLGDARLAALLRLVMREDGLSHYAPAAGLLCGLLAIEEGPALAAFLHQQTASLLAACQRLLPLGQRRAMLLLWQVKPELLRVTEQVLRGLERGEEPWQFTPLVEMGSLRHPVLETRLFIS
ncbi:urease accessory protein UreF [Thermogemmatispora sp.]|uniref:urease accessory protein UreF n=1 Tax=Thermogemmatispora sp. TaxID=1968838 RepID=UPI0035E4043E